MSAKRRTSAIKGRGALTNAASRFVEFDREPVDDGWQQDAIEPPSRPATEVFADASRSVISRNRSPDVPFDQSMNPYKGCEHGCVYCFARPTHAYLDLSPGLDFETKIFAKHDAATLLANELSRPGYQAKLIALGANTDPYQPVERRLGITRACVKVLDEYRHPFIIITKSALVERDIDLLAPMAERGGVQVVVSVTTLDHTLSQRMEPRATAPRRRIDAIRRLSNAGIPVGVLFAPVIPYVNDAELEAVLAACAEAGARMAGYVMLRLPHELKEIFRDWLEVHYPLKAAHVMNIVRDLRGGKDYDADFSQRMRGQGNYAALMAQRFKLSCKKNQLASRRHELDFSHFRVPGAMDNQLDLFGE